MRQIITTIYVRYNRHTCTLPVCMCALIWEGLVRPKWNKTFTHSLCKSYLSIHFNELELKHELLGLLHTIAYDRCNSLRVQILYECC